MSRAVVRLIAAVWIFAGDGYADETVAPETTGDGFVSLYNGKDLSGWEVREGLRKTWLADGELLSCACRWGRMAPHLETVQRFRVENGIPDPSQR